MRIRVDATSERQLKIKLDKISSDIRNKKTLQKAAKAGLKPVQKIAKELVPVVTGELRDSIRIAETDKGGILFTDKEYAGSAEYLSRPYMRPAAQKGQTQAIKEAGKVFKDIAEKNR